MKSYKIQAARILKVFANFAPSQKDNFEYLSLKKWDPIYSLNIAGDPHLAQPHDYIDFSGAWTMTGAAGTPNA